MSKSRLMTEGMEEGLDKLAVRYTVSVVWSHIDWRMGEQRRDTESKAGQYYYRDKQ